MPCGSTLPLTTAVVGVTDETAPVSLPKARATAAEATPAATPLKVPIVTSATMSRPMFCLKLQSAIVHVRSGTHHSP